MDFSPLNQSGGIMAQLSLFWDFFIYPLTVIDHDMFFVLLAALVVLSVVQIIRGILCYFGS